MNKCAQWLACTLGNCHLGNRPINNSRKPQSQKTPHIKARTHWGMFWWNQIASTDTQHEHLSFYKQNFSFKFWYRWEVTLDLILNRAQYLLQYIKSSHGNIRFNIWRNTKLPRKFNAVIFWKILEDIRCKILGAQIQSIDSSSEHKGAQFTTSYHRYLWTMHSRTGP